MARLYSLLCKTSSRPLNAAHNLRIKASFDLDPFAIVNADPFIAVLFGTRLKQLDQCYPLVILQDG